MSNDNTKVCKICDNQALLIASDYNGYIDGSSFDIYHCDYCDVNFADDTDFTTDIYQLIYKNADRTPGYNRYYYFANAIKEKANPLEYLSDSESMYWAVANVLKEKYRNKNLKMLEIGSGLGYLTYAMTQQGYDINGVDISENAVNEAKKRFGDFYLAADIFEMCKTSEKQYGLIILTEVIEHLQDPKPFIKCLLSMLEDNGQIIITTPNKTVDIQGNKWNTELPPVHLWWFSEQTAKVLAKELNCTMELVDFTEYNKVHFDKMRFKIYKGYNYNPTLNASGEVINPQVWTPVQKNLSTIIQKQLATLSDNSFFNALLTRKEYPINKSSTLAFTLTKNYYRMC